jgi:hypothetical protein
MKSDGTGTGGGGTNGEWQVPRRSRLTGSG